LEEAGGDETDFTVDVTEVRVDGVYQMLFQAEQKIVPYFSAGVGQMVFDAGEESGVSDEPATNLTYGGGLKIWFTPRIALRLDARDNVALIDKTFASESGIPTPNTKTFQANNPEFQAGLTIGFGGSDEGFGVRDTDFDGVPDKDDLCPNTPRGVIVDQTGCPVDSDSDGVPDGLDACPNTPAGATVDERGCPMDSDNDGVYDGIDRCPNTPAGTQVDETGCPIEVEVAATCLGDQSWYTSDATINVDGRNWVKFGSTKTATPDQLTQMGEYQGVPAYVGNNAPRPYREIWLPLCSPENTYQPYRLESEVRGTTGYIRDAN
jgi:OOP family OmpA-OmpF porin